MEKILLAINDKNFEDYLEKKLASTHVVVGALVHKDGILSAIESKEPDVLVLRETIQGNEDILKIMYHISTNNPNIRIVFISKDRDAGDQLLATLVSYGIYDIIPKGKVTGSQVVNAILYPNTRTDVAHYLPVSSYNEENNKIIFDSPGSPQGPTILGVGSGNIENISSGTGQINTRDEVPVKKTGKVEIPFEEEPELLKEEKVIKRKEVAKENKLLSGVSKLTRLIPEKKPKTTNQGKTEAPVINNINVTGDASKKIITFIGGRSGVGTTSVAINTAVRLASEGKKVIYLELNDKTPTASYLYNLGKNDKGIETALTSINKGNFNEIYKAIIFMQELKVSGDKRELSAFPETLDFMFFSREYLMGLSKDLILNNPKDLYMNLLFQHSYDYVIIDTDSDIKNPMTFEALIYSNVVFTVITQDISSMGYQVYRLNELSERGIDIQDKNNYVLNKYIDHEFNGQAIVEWLQTDSLTVIPQLSNEFISAAYNGDPLLSVTSDQTIINSFSNIYMKIINQ